MLHDVFDVAWLWREAGDEIVLVRGIQTWGFGSRHTGEVLLVNGRGDIAGRIGGVSASGRIRDELGATMLGDQPNGSRFVTAEISGLEAAGEGLTCGGTVRAIAQRIDPAPDLLWDALQRRTAVVLVTTIDDTGVPPWLVVTADAHAGDLAGVGAEPVLATARGLLERGTAAREVIELGPDQLLFELFAPTSRLLVVGGGELADALEAQGLLLGWSVDVATSREAAEQHLQEYAAGDALVMLSHDGSVDAPVIAEAVARHVGYIGALGSRRTQGERRRRLAELGVDTDGLANLFGPVGLDLGARTPEETALSVFAEIVAHRSGRSGAPLRSHDGPIHLQPS